MKIISLIIIFSISNLFAQENWDSVYTGTSDDLVDIFFTNDHLGWILGSSGTVLKTTDDGINWRISTIPFQELNAIKFANSNIGWIVGNNGLILKSTDGGESWYSQTGGNNYSLDDLIFFSENVGVICGGIDSYEGKMLRTTNGGDQWNEINLPTSPFPTPMLRSISFINSNLGWAVGMETAVIRTTDGGLNWEQIAHFSYLDHYSVLFLNDTTGFECGWENAGTGNTSGPIYKTSDGGYSWNWVASVGYGSFKSLAYNTNSNSLYSVGGAGQFSYIGVIYKSTDEGNNWSVVSNPSPEPLNKIIFTDHKGWIVGRSGTLLTSLIPSSVDEIDIVSNYSLLQNFPNPFNPSTSIQYAISSTQFVTLKVYDLLGREIAKLVNEEKQAGIYQVEFDASNLPSGVYFYRLKAGDSSTGSGQSFIETKKMILIK